jgi:hypothetical protein
MKTLAHQWGHIPHILQLSLAESRQMLRYQDELNNIVAHTASTPETALWAILNLNDRSESSRVFFIKPKKENDIIHRNQFTVFVPSGLMEQLTMALDRCWAAEKVEFFHTLRLFQVQFDGSGIDF